MAKMTAQIKYLNDSMDHFLDLAMKSLVDRETLADMKQEELEGIKSMFNAYKVFKDTLLIFAQEMEEQKQILETISSDIESIKGD